MEQNRKLGIAVWGVGEHATKNIIPAINKTEDIFLTGILTRNKSVSGEIARQYSCKEWSDAAEILCDKNVDIVYISSPVSVHYTQAKQVIKSKKHLWCEKILTDSYEKTF